MKDREAKMKGFAISKDRISKAKKIESVLIDYLSKEITNLKILDVGTGDGVISSYFVTKGNKVSCVDVIDQRNEKRADFFQTNSSILPFNSNEFDIVISNHVIEHIENQELHLEEIRRVLKKEAVCYFGTPNWNFPVESHYNIPFLHYLPKRAFFKILKVTNLYIERIDLPSYGDIIRLLSEFSVKEYTEDIIRNPRKYSMKSNLISKLPSKLITALVYVSPTNIFILRKK